MFKLRDEDRCPNCQAWHGAPPLEHLKPDIPCEHDRNRACDLCGESVGNLSTGGSHICSVCETDSDYSMKVRMNRFIKRKENNNEV